MRLRRAVLLLSSTLAACFPPSDGLTQGEPAIRAAFPTGSEQATECLARAWESVRLRPDGAALQVSVRRIAGTGTVAVTLPRTESVSWLIEVARAGDASSATAWSRQVGPRDLQPTLAGIMRTAVERCGGDVTDDRFERNARRRVAVLGAPDRVVPRAGLEPARLAAADFKSARNGSDRFREVPKGKA